MWGEAGKEWDLNKWYDITKTGPIEVTKETH